VSRRIIYKIRQADGPPVPDAQWDEVMKLQHWYNSEFLWSSGRIAFKRYALFPNTEEFSDLGQSIWEIIAAREDKLRRDGCSDTETIEQLERDRLVFVKWGGYFDGCHASGFTRTADNEWNAFLVCDFLLKASVVAPEATFYVHDEGNFIKTGSVKLRAGAVIVPAHQFRIPSFVEELTKDRHVFSVVDPDKYARHPALRNIIPDFNRLEPDERKTVLKNWNWLGYGDGYDTEGDDRKGFDLNKKVRDFRLEA